MQLIAGSFVTESPAPLKYSDVFVMTRSTELQDDVKDESGNVTSRASGVVRGLRAADLPVGVLAVKDWVLDRAGWESRVEDMAVARTDQITVAFSSTMCGLERRVVVVVQVGRDQSGDGVSLYNDEQIEATDRLHAMSRCTTQLVLVAMPRDAGHYHGQKTNDDNGKSGNDGIHDDGGNKRTTDNSDAAGVSWCRRGFLL